MPPRQSPSVYPAPAPSPLPVRVGGACPPPRAGGADAAPGAWSRSSSPAPILDAPAIHPGGRARRIALYSHDTMGLGHMRRNLLIAQALASSGLSASILILAGAREAGLFSMPAGVDCLALPALRKTPAGAYGARTLHVTLPQLVELRARAVQGAIEAFDPDLLVVDNVPRGALGELEPTLRSLRAGGRSRLVLGMRDVLDEAESVRREWSRAGNERVLEKYYDRVWIYGDPTVYDAVREYRFSEATAAKAEYTGYLDPRLRFMTGDPSRDLRRVATRPGSRLALCLVGGGQDGSRIAECFARAPFPPDVAGLIVTGPFLPPDSCERLEVLAADRPDLHVLGFVAEPGPLVVRADLVVSMGGYNTTCEILSFRKRALIVPRVEPRREQWVRAERLRARGLVDVIHPQELSPTRIAAWLARDAAPVPAAAIDFGGARRLPLLVQELLADNQRPSLRSQGWKGVEHAAH